MKIKEAVEIYNKQTQMKKFKEFLEELEKLNTFDIYEMKTLILKARFESIFDDLKDFADVAIKEYEEVLNGEYEKD